MLIKKIDWAIQHKGEYFITEQDLDENPNVVFVFGDNMKRVGCGGAAKLRHHPQSYGFITKKNPDYNDDSFYTPEEYLNSNTFSFELEQLINYEILEHPERTYLISKLGAGLANKYNIWEKVIRDGLKRLERYDNVKFLYK